MATGDLRQAGPGIPIDPGRVERILLVKPSSLGDVIHALPAAMALRRRFPGARLAWLVEEAWADVVRAAPAVDGVILSGRARWARAVRAGRGAGAALGEFLALLRALRAARYDLVVDLQGLLKSAVFVAATRAPLRVGLSTAREGSGAAYTHVVPASLADHAVERYLAAAWALGAPPGPAEFCLAIPAAAEAAAGELLSGAAAPAVLHPAARWATKRWTPQGFAAVGDALADLLGAPVVVTGGPEDVELCGAVAGAMRRPARLLAGRTPLQVLAAVLRRAAVMVAVDSGPLHLAAALGTPVVALFGPTAPARTGPYGPGPRRVFQAALPCVPCLSRRCRIGDRHLCMRSLSPQAVAAAALAVARGGPSPAGGP